MLKQYQKELDILRNQEGALGGEIASWKNAELVSASEIVISKELFLEAWKFLFEVQTVEDRITCRDNIEKLKKVDPKELPALAINVENMMIIDGNNRVVAFFERGIKKHPAIFMRK